MWWERKLGLCERYFVCIGDKIIWKKLPRGKIAKVATIAHTTAYS